MKNYCDLVFTDVGRECSRCFTFKPWSEYHKCKNGVKGHFSFCKQCRRDKVPAQHYQNRIDDYGRECAKCHRYLPWSEYYNDKGHTNGKSTRCRECSVIDVKLRTFHITQQEYNDLIQKHNGLCGICGKPETFINPQTNELQQLSVDHCHDSGNVRGLLCQSCNLGIGCAKDSVDIINSMIYYLENYTPYVPTRENRPKTRREYELFRTYGITDKEYEQILDSQGGKCAICGTDSNCNRKLEVDHNHSDGIIRGILCIKCNTSLGYFKDSPQTMKSAITYLSNAYIG